MMPPQLVLDHVGVVVSDLESARRAYERLGFKLTARSAHEGPLEPGGRVEAWGTGNRCAMFRKGYLELLGVVDPSRPHEHVRERLARYEGLHLIALGCEDAPALSADWSRKVEALRPVTDISRSVPQEGGGTKPARFRILHLDGHLPEAQVFAIQHVNREALWQEALLDHPNGVTALIGATIVSSDPEATARRFAALGCQTVRAKVGRRVALAQDGWIAITSPAAVEARFPGAEPPAVPSVVAATFCVSDLAVTARYLDGAGLRPRQHEGRIQVAAGDAQGCVVEFVTRSSEEGRP